MGKFKDDSEKIKNELLSEALNWTLDKIALGKLIPFPPMEGFGQVIIFQNYRKKRGKLGSVGYFWFA